MLGLAGVEVDSRGAGRGECGGDVHGYLSGLAHSGGDEFAPAAVYMFDYQLYGAVIVGRVGDGKKSPGFAL